jgi:taurine--2-oxoglutarate transaminase
MGLNKNSDKIWRKNMTKTDNEIVKNSIDYTLFSWSMQSGLNPLNIQRAQGVYLYERSGKRFLDFSSQLMNVNIGHSHPKVLTAMKKQMEELCYIYPGAVSEVRGLLGKKIAEITPKSLTKSFFVLGGAEAVENSIKVARMYSGRDKIITKYRSYHGATMGAITAGGDPRKHAVDRHQMPGVVHVEDPYCYRCPWNQQLESCEYECAQHVERVVKFENPESIAAIMMEGESGTSGCIKYPPEYWKQIKEIAERYGILLISDEVMSGFGRCGKWFGIENHGVIPDMMTCAKGITSGYVPMGALIVNSDIASHFDENPLTIGLTGSSYPLGCATALANIQVYEDEHLLENCVKMGAYLDSEIEKLKEIHPCIGDFRNTGLLGCIELVKDKKTKEPLLPWNCNPSLQGILAKIKEKILELGMFTFLKWNFIFLAPPLISSKEIIDEGVNILSKALELVKVE